MKAGQFSERKRARNCMFSLIFYTVESGTKRAKRVGLSAYPFWLAEHYIMELSQGENPRSGTVLKQCFICDMLHCG